jgi:cytochrome c peroxidase
VILYVRRLPTVLALAGLMACGVGAGAWALAARSGEAPGLAVLKRDYERPKVRPAPADNASTPRRVALGRRLFFDPALSGSGNMSCATCHDPAKAWGDGRPRGVGDAGDVLPRRSPSIVDAAWGGPYFWDGRADSLEEQAKGPIASPQEMNKGHEAAAAVVRADPGYVAAFAKAYPGEPVTIETISKAIAAFERTVVSPKAPFDRWIAGDQTAISEEAKRGFVLFNGDANCASCHSGWRFTDDGFHDIGLPSPDVGRAALAPRNPLMAFAMKTPTLRNVALRAPYMHDGSVATLEAVVDHYADGGVARPSRAPEVGPRKLSAQDREDLVAFMRTLTTAPPTAAEVARYK